MAESFPVMGSLYLLTLLERPAQVCLGVGVVVLLLLLRVALPRLRGTTLVAPLCWAVISVVVMVAAEIALAEVGNHWSDQSVAVVRYLAAVGTFCPLMGVLGAKRPQDRGWQWIVMSLWVVLAIPAGQAVMAKATAVEPSMIWQGFLWLMIAMTLLNYLPTRFWLAAMPFAAGQAVLLSGALGLVPEWSSAVRVSVGCLLLLAGASVAALQSISARQVRLSGDEGATRLAPPLRRWLTFRDRWGAFWAARVLVRFNHTAETQHWPLRLQVSGFEATTEQERDAVEIDAVLVANVQKALDAMLWRFEARHGKASTAGQASSGTQERSG